MRIKVCVGESLIEIDDGRIEPLDLTRTGDLAKSLMDHCADRERERLKPMTGTALGFYTERSWNE